MRLSLLRRWLARVSHLFYFKALRHNWPSGLETARLRDYKFRAVGGAGATASSIVNVIGIAKSATLSVTQVNDAHGTFYSFASRLNNAVRAADFVVTRFNDVHTKFHLFVSQWKNAARPADFADTQVNDAHTKFHVFVSQLNIVARPADSAATQVNDAYTKFYLFVSQLTIAARPADFALTPANDAHSIFHPSVDQLNNAVRAVFLFAIKFRTCANQVYVSVKATIRRCIRFLIPVFNRADVCTSCGQSQPGDP